MGLRLRRSVRLFPGIEDQESIATASQSNAPRDSERRWLHVVAASTGHYLINIV